MRLYLPKHMILFFNEIRVAMEIPLSTELFYHNQTTGPISIPPPEMCILQGSKVGNN